jgi:hypothetical protein
MHARIGMLQALNRHVERVFNPRSQRSPSGAAQASAGSMTRRRRYAETDELSESLPAFLETNRR